MASRRSSGAVRARSAKPTPTAGWSGWIRLPRESRRAKGKEGRELGQDELARFALRSSLFARRPIRPPPRKPSSLGHRPLHHAVRILHAGRELRLAPEGIAPHLRGARPAGRDLPPPPRLEDPPDRSAAGAPA